MRSDISRRVIELITAVTPAQKRLPALEKETGISSNNWRNVWKGNQRATVHMLEALGRRWPQYAFWLITGITDEENGHTAPPDAWTCSQERSTTPVELAAKKYFELKIYGQDSIYGRSNATENNLVEKRNPSEQEKLSARIANEPNSSEDSNITAMVESFFGAEDIKVFKKKYSDLDYALEKIAFDRRMKSFSEQFFPFYAHDHSHYREQLDILQQQRKNLTITNNGDQET